ncbi:hypothetical protein [Alcanivorax sp.]|uniref:hypothetical protein n=1 Tax=Alcanivorax sp. TaxID=1872427 RepID=UPI00260CD28B|nr:hypothetical protein [Alcanivorax sp.]
MSTRMRNYRIDFYQINIHPTDDVRNPWAGFNGIEIGLFADRAHHNGVTREIWRLRTDLPGPEHYFGQFRKFRNEDLPEVGSAGSAGRDIDLEDDEGIIEKNFFAFFRQHNILAWHMNGHGSTPNQFAKVLSEIWSCRVSIDPVVGSDALRRLMNGGTILTGLSLSIPRPTNPDIYLESEFGRDTLNLLNGSGGDSLKLAINVDARRGDSEGGLVNEWKAALRDLLRIDVRNARATVNEGGFEDTINLIADRVQSTQQAETDSKFPSSRVMNDLIIAARNECNESITEYFGEGGNVLD